DLELHRRLASVADRPRADVDPELPRVAAAPDPLGDAFGPRVLIGKVQILAAARASASFLARRHRLTLEAGEALHDVAKEARLALLAVRDDVDADLGLPAHHLTDGVAHQPSVCVAIVRLTSVLRCQDGDGGSGRDRLPTCVVRIRSVLRFIAD